VWGRSHEEVIGRPLFDVLPELRSQPFRALLDRVLRSGEPYVGKETPARLGTGASGRIAYFNFVYAPLRDPNGEVEGIMVMAFDVSDEIRARDQLARAVQYSEMFTGILAHDLRGPLAAVVTSGHLILRRSGDEQIVKPVQRMLSSAERMTRMINQLLDFTRIRLGGGLALERSTCDLGELLRRVLAEVEGAAPGWRFELEAVGDAVGEWDADRLAQVVSNLAGNAAQHGSRETPLRVKLDGGDGAAVIVSFENQGQISPELVPTLFEPFRGRAEAREASKGLGLGLFISREIIVAHGGEISVTSTGEGGTRFQIVLPRRGGDFTAGLLPRGGLAPDRDDGKHDAGVAFAY
jgi:PAS domain S-box-containing protein